MVREYTYAYGAFCPQDGASTHFILPAMDGACMTFFLRHVRESFPDDFILMVYDGAPGHSPGVLHVPDHMMLVTLPPYSPELNPSEHIWDDMREKFFGNTVFNSMNAVRDQLCIAMNHYAGHPETVRSITAFPWIWLPFERELVLLRWPGGFQPTVAELFPMMRPSNRRRVPNSSADLPRLTSGCAQPSNTLWSSNPLIQRKSFTRR